MPLDNNISETRSSHSGPKKPQRTESECAVSTHLLHHPYEPPPGFAATAPPIQKASTVFFPSLAAMRQRHWLKRDGYTYGLHGTPASFTLAERLATLEGARHCLLAPSGLAAITLVYQALLSAGDAAFVSASVYNPNRDFALAFLPRYGIAVMGFEPMQPETLRSALSESHAKTKLVWLEAAASLTMEFPNLPELIRIAHDAGAVVALDSTWSAGLAYAPFALPEGASADISVQALTK